MSRNKLLIQNDEDSVSTCSLEALDWSFYTHNESARLAVCNVHQSQHIDELGLFIRHGLCDPHMGPVDNRSVCEFCGKHLVDCEGHFGRIELPLPVYHPVFFRTVVKLVKASCLKCSTLMKDSVRETLFIYQMRAVDAGFEKLVFEMTQVYNEGLKELRMEMRKHKAEQKKLHRELHPSAAGDEKNDDDDELVVDEKTMAETLASADPILNFEKRLKKMLKHAKLVKTEDDASENQSPSKTVYSKHAAEIREEVLSSFLKNGLRTTTKRCSNCGSLRPKSSQQGDYKIIIEKVNEEEELIGFEEEKSGKKPRRNRKEVLLPSARKAADDDTDEDESAVYTASGSAAAASTSRSAATTSTTKRRKKSKPALPPPSITNDSGVGSRSSFSDNHSPSDRDSDNNSDGDNNDADTVVTGGKSSNGTSSTKTSSSSRAGGVNSQFEVLSPIRVRDHCRRLWVNHSSCLRHVFSMLAEIERKCEFPTDLFFLDSVNVAPNRFRPLRGVGGRRYLDGQSTIYNRVIQDSSIIRELCRLREQARAKLDTSIEHDDVLNEEDEDMAMVTEALKQEPRLSSLPGATLHAKLQNQYFSLQVHVNSLMNEELDKINSRAAGAGGRSGVKQMLERKEGMFRQNMMGKRVNYSARSVIAPDPNLHLHEVGIPRFMAEIITIAEPCIESNYFRLRQAVLNGPQRYPGATLVIMEDGRKVSLPANNPQMRAGIANSLLRRNRLDVMSAQPKIVYRHMLTGDPILLNRQPSLHRSSMLGHIVRVLPNEKTIRLHYANCKAYNADFDGDEMNVHCPQDEISRTELLEIALAPHNYVVPKDGLPSAGLIQDHISASVLMTLRDTFFDRTMYQQLVTLGLSGIPLVRLLYNAAHRRRARAQRQRAIQGGERRASSVRGDDDDEEHNSVSQCLFLLPPAIMHPQQLWTGKQVISTVFLNTIPADRPPPTFNSASKIKPEHFNSARRVKKSARKMLQRFGVLLDDDELTTTNDGRKSNDLVVRNGKLFGEPTWAQFMSDTPILMRRGELISGILDKTQFGSSAFGLVHLAYELYGGRVSAQLLSGLGRVLTKFLDMRGFSFGYNDVLLNQKVFQRRNEMVQEKVRASGRDAVIVAMHVPDITTLGTSNVVDLNDEEKQRRMRDDEVIRDAMQRAQFDVAAAREAKALEAATKDESNACTSDLNREYLPRGLLVSFPKNHLQTMIISGAKGTTVNSTQTTCVIGQVELEGQRPPLMLSGRCLPCFRPYDWTPRARGYVDQSYITGQKPAEYFFQCMAGREGLVDTAVKTSRSGYLQRCLIKHMEALMVQYDHTVRDSEGAVIQFLYGEDGMDVCRSAFFARPDACVAAIDNLGAAADATIEKLKKVVNYKRAEKYNRDIVKRWQKKLEGAQFVDDDAVREPDPCTAIFPPQTHLGSISEQQLRLLKQCTDLYEGILQRSGKIPHRENDENDAEDAVVLADARKRFKRHFFLRAMEALAHPGEAVGVIAGQSIGEPSTQMTLNTFHFAGQGEMNLTLGIPRLKEVLMSATVKIRSPFMQLPLRTASDYGRGGLADRLAKSWTRVPLASCLERVEADEEFAMNADSNQLCTRWRIKFYLLPTALIRDLSGNITRTRVLQYIEDKFLPLLCGRIEGKKSMKEATKVEKSGPSNAGRPKKAGEDDDGGKNNDEAGDDGDLNNDAEIDDDENDNAPDAEDAKFARQRADMYQATDRDDERVIEQQNDEQNGVDYIDADDADVVAARKTKAKPKLLLNDEDDADLDYDGNDENVTGNVDDDADNNDDETGPSGRNRRTLTSYDELAGMDKAEISRQARVNRVRSRITALVSYTWEDVTTKLRNKRRSRVANDSQLGLAEDTEEAPDDSGWCEFVLHVPVNDSFENNLQALLDTCIKNAVLHHVPGLVRAFRTHMGGGDNPNNLCIMTEGINFNVVVEEGGASGLIDLDRVYTNSTHAMAEHYGIEAAYECLIKECRDVFNVYGIKVDRRHLSLIADYMTHSGWICGFNRNALSKLNTSPFQKMSFETALTFVRQAATNAFTDMLTSPSACQIVGKLAPVGTGTMQLMHKLS